MFDKPIDTNGISKVGTESVWGLKVSTVTASVFHAQRKIPSDALR
jgi:hypothetical protein